MNNTEKNKNKHLNMSSKAEKNVEGSTNSIKGQIKDLTTNIKDLVSREVKSKEEKSRKEKTEINEQIKIGINEIIESTEENVKTTLENRAERAERCDKLLEIKKKELRKRRILNIFRVKTRNGLIIKVLVSLAFIATMMFIITDWSNIKNSNLKSSNNEIIKMRDDLTTSGDYTGTSIKLSSTQDDNKLNLELNSLTVSAYDRYYTLNKELLRDIESNINIKADKFTYNSETYEISDKISIETVDCYGKDIMLAYKNDNNTLMREVVIQGSDEAAVTKKDIKFDIEDNETGIKSNNTLSNKIEYKDNYNGLGFIFYDAISSGEILRDENSLSLKTMLSRIIMNTDIESELLEIELEGFGKISVNSFNSFQKGTGFYYSKKDNFIKVINDGTNTSYMYIANVNNEYINSDCSNYIQIGNEIWKSNNFEDTQAKDYRTFIIRRGKNEYMIKTASDEIMNEIIKQLNIDTQLDSNDTE